MAPNDTDIPLISPYSTGNFQSYLEFLHTQGDPWKLQWLQEFFKGKSKDGETLQQSLTTWMAKSLNCPFI
jgi:hypothetical protein